MERQIVKEERKGKRQKGKREKGKKWGKQKERGIPNPNLKNKEEKERLRKRMNE